jgi:hypothetical protein
MTGVERDRRRNEARRAAGKRYYQRHPNKVRERRKAFYAKNRKQALAYAKLYRKKHFEQVSAQERACRAQKKLEDDQQ